MSAYERINEARELLSITAINMPGTDEGVFFTLGVLDSMAGSHRRDLETDEDLSDRFEEDHDAREFYNRGRGRA